MICERALQYASQLEAHLDEDGGFNVGNVRDLIGFVSELVADGEGWVKDGACSTCGGAFSTACPDCGVIAEALAQRFHETYERLAPQFGYRTREESARPWEEIPERNQRLMVAVCAEILRDSGSRPEGENAERSGAVEGEARQSGSPSEIAQTEHPTSATGEREGE
jgi:hypothetical protein